MSTQLDPLRISADLLAAVKSEPGARNGLGIGTGTGIETESVGDTTELRAKLAHLDRDRLARALSSRQPALAFWINCYNAYAQLLLEHEGASVLEGGVLERWRFFARDRVPVAGARLSLADIEHGILRGSKHPWGLGYLPRLSTSTFERRFRLAEVDPRIHFALSHGSENCPPIAVYSPDDCEEELEVATEWFVEENVRYDPERGVAIVPKLFSRYRGDFGGKRGILSFLRRYDAIPEAATPTLQFDEDGWSVDVHGTRS